MYHDGLQDATAACLKEGRKHITLLKLLQRLFPIKYHHKIVGQEYIHAVVILS